MSNADLPDRQSSQGVGMYVFALYITTDQVEGKTVLSGSSADFRFFLYHKTKTNMMKKEG